MKDDRESHSPSDRPAVPSDERADNAARPTWRAPTVTRITLEHTLASGGSPNDNLFSGTTPR
jgi:hypothetical protein